MDESQEITEVVYSGECDVIRSQKYQWQQFKGDGTELIVGKSYGLITECCMQRVWIMKDDEMVPDNTGERYRYYKIHTEQGEPIYVWDGFFEGKTL